MGKGVFRLGIWFCLLAAAVSACDPSVDILVGCDVGQFIQAINDANSDPDHTRIRLADDCVYSLNAYDNQVDKLGNPSGHGGNNGFPVITTPITIEGRHATINRSNTAPQMRFFLIQPGGILTLEDLTLEYGLVQSGYWDFQHGGSILNLGRFNLLRSEILHSYAEESGGAIANESTGEMLISMSTINGCTAVEDGGAVLNRGELEIRDGTKFENNIAQARGGAIMNAGSLSITQSEFVSNEANQIGGAILAWQAMVNSFDRVSFEGNQSRSHAGAIYFNLSTFTLTDSTFDGNEGDMGGGLVLDSSSGEVQGTTFVGNIGTNNGGAIVLTYQSSISIDQSSFLFNHSDISGGALFLNQAIGEVVVNHSTFRGNEAIGYGGGIISLNSITVRNSTISGNSARTGGGIYNSGHKFNLNNSTVSGNIAELRGGGIANYGTLKLLFSTVAYNQAGEGAGIFDQGVLFKVKNSIISNNTPLNCSVAVFLNALGDNLDDDGTCPGFTATASPFLGALADNGGPTQTHAIMFSSPAVDGATDCTNIPGSSSVATDQRGETRPFGALCDLGAYEAQAPLNIFNIIVQVHVELLDCNDGPNPMFMVMNSYSSDDDLTVLGRNLDGSWLGIAGMDGQADEVVCWVPSDGVDSPEPIMSFPILRSPEHPPEPGMEGEGFDRCTQFAPETYSLTLMDIPYGSGQLQMYVLMPGGIPGLEIKVAEDPEGYEYLGMIGDYTSKPCTFEGYPGRLFCNFELPEAYLGTVRVFNLMVNGCLNPIYTHSMLTIPEPVEPTAPIACIPDLEEAACIEAGGTYSCGASAACTCICP